MNDTEISNYLNLNFKAKTDSHGELNWTPSAVACYKCGCNCSICDIPRPTEHCYMKSTVLDLVRKIGSPEEYFKRLREEEEKNRQLLKYTQDQVKKGRSIKDVARELNIKYWYLLETLHEYRFFIYERCQ